MLYRRHMQNHAEEKPHRCPKCPASFNIPVSFFNEENFANYLKEKNVYSHFILIFQITLTKENYAYAKTVKQ